MAKQEVLTPSPKKDNTENKFIRSAQSVGAVKLNLRKEFEIIKDSNHLKKGQKVKLNAATEGLFRAKGLIK
jgi:hypothetical protein